MVKVKWERLTAKHQLNQRNDYVPFNKQAGTMEYADVELMSESVMACNSLAAIADILGKKADTKEIKDRSLKYGEKL
jgi:hypothetical protein